MQYLQAGEDPGESNVTSLSPRGRCCVTISLGDMNKCLLTPKWGLTTDHSEDTSKVHIGESMSFTGFPYRSRGER